LLNQISLLLALFAAFELVFSIPVFGGSEARITPLVLEGLNTGGVTKLEAGVTWAAWPEWDWKHEQEGGFEKMLERWGRRRGRGRRR
jgi:hypothetical protein